MAKEKQTEVKILTEAKSFPRTMFYNRVALESLGVMRVFHFGLTDDGDTLRDSYTCMIDEEALLRHKDEILSYVARASSEPTAELPAWRPKFSATAIDVANVLRVARIGNIAELRFHNFSIGDVLEARNEGPSNITSAPVALLRCELQLQRSLFLSLYSKGPAKNAKK